MHRRPAPSPAGQPDILALAAATWLACGIVLLGLTPLPLRDASLGWSPAFWLLMAPLLLLTAKRLLIPRRSPAPARRQSQPPRRSSVQAKRRHGMAIAQSPCVRNRTRRIAA
ncbi:MAG: hypothetical protein EPN40_09920 [Rhodanobacteraceae bacterium]|nr:MAG: hypothetical protein EPN40_09920 [Rhodanobacteraceae bacterium]